MSDAVFNVRRLGWVEENQVNSQINIKVFTVKDVFEIANHNPFLQYETG
jgi:hypothetical protein